MIDERGVLRRIAWQEIFPWLMILRTFRVAIAPSVLALAVVGTLVAPWGRVAGSYLFLSGEERTQMREPLYGGWPALPPGGTTLRQHVPAAVEGYLPHVPNGIVAPFFYYAEPVWRLFLLRLPLHQALFYAFASLWSLAVWAFCGGAIARQAVLRLAVGQSSSVREAVRFAGRRYLYYLLAPLYPLLGVFVITLVLVPLGWLMRLDIGVAVAGVLWVFVVLLGLVAVWLLVGLLFGFPLMWPVISAEREGDAFEAFSRSFAYVYGRPLHYLFYALVAALFGTLCLAVVDIGAETVQEFGFSATSWGAGGERTALVRAESALPRLFAPGDSSNYGALDFGALMIWFWLALVRLVASAFTFSFFWSAASALYLLLRLDVDDKETDEVYQPEDEFRFAASRRALAESISSPDAAPPMETPPTGEAE